MEFIKEIFLYNAFSSLKLSAVVILLFALTKPITKQYTAGFRYYSWLAVMLIFLIPFARLGIDYTINISPSVTNGINNIRTLYEEKAPEYSVTEEYSGYEHAETHDSEKAEYIPVTKTTTEKKRVDITAIFAVVWLIGVFVYFILHYGRYVYFRHGLKRLSNIISDDCICGCMNCEREKMKILKPLKIRYSQLIDTPMLVGLIKPEIILPRLDYTDDELQLILRHELFHFKRKDIVYQFIILVFVSFHWFNPIVHLMAKAIEIDGETSCDEKTLEGKSYEERIFYGEMLLKFLRTETQKRSYMTTTFFGGKKGMKKRLILIADKKARRKGTAAMVIVMLFAVMTSICAAAMNNEYFNEIFDGDTSYLADFVKSEKKSVEDDRFKLTLEQYLVAENQAMIVYSFEAKTADAIEELNSKDFLGMDTITFGPTDYEKAKCQGYSVRDIAGKGLNTENKIYGFVASDNIKNEEKIDFYLSTDKIKDCPKIIVPMDYNMETKTVELDNATVSYNPISISVDYIPTEADSDCDFDFTEWEDTYFYFRMKNNEIKTFYQLYEQSDGETYTDENGEKHHKENAWAREIIRPDEIKSVIINDTEYPIDNPSNSKHIAIDEHMKPFIIDAYAKEEHLWIPLRAFCDGLGAEIKWDGDTKTASFNYCGSSFAFTVGKAGIVVDGEECDFGTEAPFIDEYGRMIVPPNFDGYNNHTYIVAKIHTYNAILEDDSLNPNAQWYIIP